MPLNHPLPDFDPPLLNSSSYWASSEEQLSELYNCTSTGAITVRTSLLDGFPHDPEIHQFGFFENSSGKPHSGSVVSSLNTIGYSPIPLPEYIDIIARISSSSSVPTPKPVIFSVTGSAMDVRQALDLLETSPCKDFAALEINLSCPNIPGHPPPAYDLSGLEAYIAKIPEQPKIPVGLKLAPFTYHDQFEAVLKALNVKGNSPIAFLTSSNTLGMSLILDEETLDPILNSATGRGIGGMAGAALHPIALGNVKRLREMLDQSDLKHIKIIGVGGVSDHAGFERMRKVGASAVGLATALGAEGVGVFAKILKT